MPIVKPTLHELGGSRESMLEEGRFESADTRLRDLQTAPAVMCHLCLFLTLASLLELGARMDA